MHPTEKPVFFFGDAHLTTLRNDLERERAERVSRFLAHVRDHASSLYILGDLFDFWFEYRHAVPNGHVAIFHRLCELREANVPTTFLAGNHDYWCLPFLRREFGIATHAEPITATAQGRHLWLAHGDGLVRADWAYRRLRSVLRNPLCVAAYRLIHPDLGIPLAHRSSGTSRQYTETRHQALDSYRNEVVLPKFREGFDAVVMGHVHIPTHEKIDGKDFLFVGDWLTRFTYVTLSGGVFAQHRWSDGP
jgi:UDP-2,3-diacylglucosamine hydrolase